MSYTSSGAAVCQIGMALNRRWKDPSGTLREDTTFVDVSIWGRQAETVASYLTKGRAVAVEGRLQLDTWQTEGGERRSRLKVVAQRVTFLSWANGGPAPAAATGEDVPDWVNEEVER